MKCLFIHISKNGGSSIRKAAEANYGSNFHTLLSTSTEQDLETWLQKETVFISSELHGLNKNFLNKLLSCEDLYRCTLARDPISRFRSFCAYSTKIYSSSQDQLNIGYWDLLNNLGENVQTDLNFWLECCLTYVTNILTGSEHIELTHHNQKLYFGVYSQWFIASFMSYPRGGELTYTGDNILEHIRGSRWCIRSGQSLESNIENFTREFYDCVGTTNHLDIFLAKLQSDGVFSNSVEIPHINSTKTLQNKYGFNSELRSDLIAKFYALIPEDFFFHSACRKISINY